MLTKITGSISSQRKNQREDLFLAASSFEPRCCRAGELLEPGAVTSSVIFRYSDTLDSALGLANTRSLTEDLRIKCASVDVLDCSFSDPYSVVRSLRPWLRDTRHLLSKRPSISIDISCFTKLHLLLLLEHLHREFPDQTADTRIIYTEPLSYAASFGRQLSYGIKDTVHIPFSSPSHETGQTALIIFLGHEALRAEKIIEELEPELIILVQGSQGYSEEMYSTHLGINRALLDRVKYNHQYRLLAGSPRDFLSLAAALEGMTAPLVQQGFGTFYLAPLGTKLQTVAFELLRRSNPDLRLLVSYAIPKRYERKYYSQGVGPSWASTIPKHRQSVPQELIEVGGVYYSDPFHIPITALNRATPQFHEHAINIIIQRYGSLLHSAFISPEVTSVCLCEGTIARTATSDKDLTDEYLITLQRETGRLCYVVQREDFELPR